MNETPSDSSPDISDYAPSEGTQLAWKTYRYILPQKFQDIEQLRDAYLAKLQSEHNAFRRAEKVDELGHGVAVVSVEGEPAAVGSLTFHKTDRNEYLVHAASSAGNENGSVRLAAAVVSRLTRMLDSLR
ncbi:hypothetical protein [Rhodococcoides kroppenstedtii]|uniref:hypothetical protein n=1 Tax=Rhodococcoides kroppenstedtii TaxID=293050 RepID=UPI001427E313|nr:hypothetical protein [Rhodococcus kroppenstedtii]NIL81076.1 hypothetical protein [Rhodococcus kroppenstedtii]